MKNNFEDNSLDPVTTYTDKIVDLENVGESFFFNTNSSSSCKHLQTIQGSEDLQLSRVRTWRCVVQQRSANG